MFRKLTERISAAVMGYDNNNVQTLISMGFDSDSASRALQATNNNVDQAAELLLASGGDDVATRASTTTQPQPQQQQQQQSARAPINNNNSNNNDADLRRVMEESMQLEEERRVQEALTESRVAYGGGGPQQQQQQRTAAMNKAAEAAARRQEEAAARNRSNKKKKTPATKTRSTTATTTMSVSRNSAQQQQPQQQQQRRGNVSPPPVVAAPPIRTKSNGLSKHHPDVKMIPKLQDKTKEEQVLRCMDRVRSHPHAVDTLLRALMAVQNDPNNGKYRTIDKSNTGYQRSIVPVPGAEDLLRAMNYRDDRYRNSMILDFGAIDPALLFLGISALEQARLTDEYKQAKEKANFAKVIQNILDNANNNSKENDQSRRRRGELYKSKCPIEPTGGRGALVQVHMAEHIVRRRFDGDDTIQDVLHWLGGYYDISIYDHILQDYTWSMIDRNRYPAVPIDCNTHLHNTLQYIGCWPSGKLEILPSTEEWKIKQQRKQEGEGDNMNIEGGGRSSNTTTTIAKLGSSRGLGSAPSEVL